MHYEIVIIYANKKGNICNVKLEGQTEEIVRSKANVYIDLTSTKLKRFNIISVILREIKETKITDEFKE